MYRARVHNPSPGWTGDRMPLAKRRKSAQTAPLPPYAPAMSRPRQILALGGGGFSMEAGNPLLDEHALALTGVEGPEECFLPAALAGLLLAQDLVYVGGGSLISLLGTWTAHGVDLMLRAAWERGVVMAGL